MVRRRGRCLFRQRQKLPTRDSGANDQPPSRTLMQLAMIGLGKMGGNMVERLMRNGHSLVAYDRAPATTAKYQQIGGSPAKDLADVVGQLASPRVVWIMVPAGK